MTFPRRFTMSGDPGIGLVDLLVVVATVVILLGVSIPVSLDAMERQRVESAARFIAGVIAEARMAALTRGEATGLSFGSEEGQRPVLQLVQDGDGDGVNTDDRTRGVDRIVRTFGGLESYRGVGLCITRSGPSPDAAEQLTAGARAIRFGADDTLRFGPDGVGTSGSVYVCVEGGAQAAVRVFGTTGRVRVLLQRADGSWASS